MKYVLALVIAAALASAETKPLPNQAGNDDLDLAGTVLIDRPAIQDAVGADLGPGYIVVRISATPKSNKPLRLSPDDFLLLSRKDGDRSPALDPAQFGGGSGGLVVKAAAAATRRRRHPNQRSHLGRSPEAHRRRQDGRETQRQKERQDCG